MGIVHGAKSIDFDQVADLYDSFVRVDFDLDFWRHEAKCAKGNVLELMCGTGRIGMPLIEAGARYTGVDYCRKQIDQFERKLATSDEKGKVVFQDAREFDLNESFDLIFIGFSSFSEILDNTDKIKLLERVRSHLKPSGHFTFSLHNPADRRRQLEHAEVFALSESRSLEFHARFQPPNDDELVSGTESFVITDQQGAILERRELGLTFHLISMSEIELLLARVGFEVVQIWGDYERAPFEQASRFMIFRCKLAAHSPADTQAAIACG